MSLQKDASGANASLRTRVLLLTLLLFASLSVPAYVAFQWMVDRTIVKLGTLFAEKQVYYDRYRGMETLSREASLAATLARSPAIVEWGRDEADPEKTARGLAELDHYRQAFADKSVFYVVDASGNYYFNDRDSSYAGAELRYAVSRDNPRDGWYFKTIETSPNCQLNVDHDDVLLVTKVWINCPVFAGDRIIGVAGSGIDLTSFIREVVNLDQPGVESIFVDMSGAIQAHRDASLVDYHSLTKSPTARKTIFSLVDSQADRDNLAAMMQSVSGEGGGVEAQFVRIGGQKYLAGVGYLDNLGWFNVSLMNIDRIIDRQLFTPIACLLGAMLLLAVLLVTLLFKRVVLDRLARLEMSVRRVQSGDYAVPRPDTGNDEIARLSRAFVAMATAVSDNAESLEAIVRERTAQLEHLAEIDPLTDAYNRRGFMRAVERERSRADRTGGHHGLLLIDLDHLKQVNDTNGHQAGDLVLLEVVRRIRSSLRGYDISARWGGDEFAVFIADCDAETLAAIGAKLLAAVNEKPVEIGEGKATRVTVSIGACLIGDDESLDAIASKADSALYAAKGAGRDHFVVYDEKQPKRVRAAG